MGPYRAIQGYIGPYGALWGRDPHVLCWQSPWLLLVSRSHMGPCEAIWGYWRPYGAIWGHIGIYRALWGAMGP